MVAAILGLVQQREHGPGAGCVVDDDEWKAEVVARGLPAPAADFTLGMFRAARNSEFAATDPTLERLLGRPAISARATIKEIVASHQ